MTWANTVDAALAGDHAAAGILRDFAEYCDLSIGEETGGVLLNPLANAKHDVRSIGGEWCVVPSGER